MKLTEDERQYIVKPCKNTGVNVCGVFLKEKAMTVRDIIQEYLKKNGYDGLYNEAGDCACLVDDLMPCTACEGVYVDDCEPGYKTPCDCGGHDWHISANKEDPYVHQD